MSNPTYQPNPGQRPPGSFKYEEPKGKITEEEMTPRTNSNPSNPSSNGTNGSSDQLSFDFGSIGFDTDIPIPDENQDRARQVLDSMDVGHSFRVPFRVYEFFKKASQTLRPKTFVSAVEEDGFRRIWRKS